MSVVPMGATVGSAEGAAEGSAEGAAVGGAVGIGGNVGASHAMPKKHNSKLIKAPIFQAIYKLVSISPSTMEPDKRIRRRAPLFAKDARVVCDVLCVVLGELRRRSKFH